MKLASVFLGLVGFSLAFSLPGSAQQRLDSRGQVPFNLPESVAVSGDKIPSSGLGPATLVKDALPPAPVATLPTSEVAPSPAPDSTPTVGYVPPAGVPTARVAPGEPFTFWLPSEKPSGDEINDRIWVTFYPARGLRRNFGGQGAPTVLLLHYLGSGDNAELHEYAAYLAQRGIASAVMTQPYHMQRLRRGDNPYKHYVAPDSRVVAQAFDQSASDASTVVTWLCRQPSVDKSRIAAAGLSLGAIVTHIAMGRDDRISAGVAMLGGGNLLNVFETGILTKLFVTNRPNEPTAEDRARLRTIDPLYTADNNRPNGGPRRVLMVEAARDLVIPPRDAEELWRALGKPPIQWIDTNHVALRFASASVMRTATAYLESVWSGQDVTLQDIPRVQVPTIKVGFITGLDSYVTPAIQLQALRLGTRHHMAFLHADVGLTGRGFFGGLAVTVSQFLDVGVGRRLGKPDYRPYASVHFVF